MHIKIRLGNQQVRTRSKDQVIHQLCMRTVCLVLPDFWDAMNISDSLSGVRGSSTPSLQKTPLHAEHARQDRQAACVCVSIRSALPVKVKQVTDSYLISEWCNEFTVAQQG
jgi:hypothetical protein